MTDESLREFQLNGKQLVFLFMASTIVAVVIFLCGVMVGRGVSAAQVSAAPSSLVDAGDPTAGNAPDPVVAPPATPPADVAPDAPGDEELKYPGVLTEARPTADLLPPKPSPPAEPKKAPAPAAAARTAAPSPAPAPAAEVADVPEPAGNGFVVQVAATPRRSEADAIRGRLQKKGYPAFVTTSGKVYRVRVGKYKDRSEAMTVSKRLETEERFKPWVTR